MDLKKVCLLPQQFLVDKVIHQQFSQVLFSRFDHQTQALRHFLCGCGLIRKTFARFYFYYYLFLIP